MSNMSKANKSDVESDNESRISSTNASTKSETSSAQRSSTKGTKRKSKAKNHNKVVKSLYRFNCFVTEENAKQIFAVQFNHFIKDRDVFAAASGHRITIYECVKETEDISGIKLLRAYDDPDRDEVFYTLAWSFESDGPIIACGGVRSVVRILFINGPGLREKTFIGHTNAINEMKFHPTLPHLLLTASKDHSMRLWNVKTDICVAIFGGVSGHRDEVLAIDFDVQGRHIVSGGMDHNLKVWKIDTEEVQTAIKESATYFDVRRVRSFPTLHIHFADFTTRKIHRNYVDSVKWFGDSFLSKSCENCVVWWKAGNLNEPGLNLNSTTATQIHSFTVDECELWFVRMDLDTTQRYLAVGNSHGKIFCFDLESDSPNIRPSVMSHHNCKQPIRQIAFSRNSDILVASCDDGKIWRWDKRL